MFSYHKYNNLILIQEIFDKFWCKCNGDKAALTAAAQADAQRLAQEKANAMKCDCPEPECRRSVTARITQRHYGSAPGVTYEVEDTSTNCSGSECNAKTATVRFSCGDESHTQRVTLTCGGYTSSTEFFSSSCDADSITVSASY